VVQRNAVERLADSARVKAANRKRAARRAVRVIILEADARQVVDRIVDRLARTLLADELLRQDRAGLGARRIDDSVDAVVGLLAGDDDLGRDGTGGLGENSRRQQG